MKRKSTLADAVLKGLKEAGIPIEAVIFGIGTRPAPRAQKR